MAEVFGADGLAVKEDISTAERVASFEKLSVDVKGRYKLATLLQKRMRDLMYKDHYNGIEVEKPLKKVLEEIEIGDTKLLNEEEGQTYLEELAKIRAEEEAEEE